MSKMSELSQVLDELITCGEGLIRTAGILKEMFAEPETAAEPAMPATIAEPATIAVPETVAQSEEAPAQKTYSYVEVRKACAAKSNAGFTARIKALIEKYGADRLSSVKEEDYAALMAELEVIR